MVVGEAWAAPRACEWRARCVDGSATGKSPRLEASVATYSSLLPFFALFSTDACVVGVPCKAQCDCTHSQFTSVFDWANIVLVMCGLAVRHPCFVLFYRAYVPM